MDEVEIRYKEKPRCEENKENLKKRLHRMQGQLAGIEKMVDENRYCKDILIQLHALQKGLQAAGRIILKEHLETCVQDQIKAGEENVMDEVMDLFDKLR